MSQSLEDLRAANAAEEAAAAAAPQATATETTDDAVDDLNDDDNLAEGDEGEEGQKPEPESWMKGDDQESQSAEKKFTDSDIGAAKAKVRAKLDVAKSEIEQLRAQLEEARRSTVAPQLTARPKRDDFYDQDDPDDAYTEALADWKLKESQARQHQETQQYEFQRKQLEAQKTIESGVDQHYERAATLAAASGISPDEYRLTDLRVKQAIEGVFPNGGEPVMNALIASLGPGSEKVFYNLGRNTKRLEELVSSLKEDPSGLRAARYLGKLDAELSAPLRKRSNTPAPATNVQGDANTTDLGKGLMRKYQEAHKRGDTQAAYDIRREAKAKNINVKSW